MSALYNSDAKFHPVRTTTQKHFRLHIIQKPFKANKTLHYNSPCPHGLNVTY